MSIDLNWAALTTGSDGEALAATIKDFIHARFQSTPLPRFIKSVTVHSFAFGDTPPEVEIKDICDPLPDFYEGSEDEEDEDENADEHHDGHAAHGWEKPRRDQHVTAPPLPLQTQPHQKQQNHTQGHGQAQAHGLPHIDMRPLMGLRSHTDLPAMGSPFLGASTPGIPGGTSNLSYFHSQLAPGRSGPGGGSQTPLAAVAGAQMGWPGADYGGYGYGYGYGVRPGHKRNQSTGDSRPGTGGTDAGGERVLREKHSVSTLAASSVATTTLRPRTQDGLLEESVSGDGGDEGASDGSGPRRFRERRVEDLQTVFRVRYSGDVRLSLTAEILLDYPMPSFVGIPVKLNITGLSFDGVAVLAYIRKRAHFCFLSPEDAVAAIGAEGEEAGLGMPEGKGQGGLRMGGLLQEIKVESEIGQRENGKQVLKNVGKVEKFVLEQVRRIFEDEFVYPSFWTFLV